MTATGYFMLHGLSDETASIPLKLIDFLEEIRRQCDGDSLCGSHSNSMTQSMIISPVLLCPRAAEHTPEPVVVLVARAGRGCARDAARARRGGFVGTTARSRNNASSG
jgi:hypothetical protein